MVTAGTKWERHLCLGTINLIEREKERKEAAQTTSGPRIKYFFLCHNFYKQFWSLPHSCTPPGAIAVSEVLRVARSCSHICLSTKTNVMFNLHYNWWKIPKSQPLYTTSPFENRALLCKQSPSHLSQVCNAHLAFAKHHVEKNILKYGFLSAGSIETACRRSWIMPELRSGALWAPWAHWK